MNFLGHILLTGEDEDWLLGNFMADSIKGKGYLDYPEAVQKGVLLHRFIDSYTDDHPAFRQSTSKLHADFGHYSGVLVDVFYDHFIAANWKDFYATPLEEFTDNFYQKMQAQFDEMTPRMQYLFPYMQKHNWLMRYPTLEGIELTLTEMGSRIGKEYKLHTSVRNLEQEYDAFKADFDVFIADIIKATKEKREELRGM